ncbi:acid protease [Meredithblackwellia eburnea MCA 4105]
MYLSLLLLLTSLLSRAFATTRAQVKGPVRHRELYKPHGRFYRPYVSHELELLGSKYSVFENMEERRKRCEGVVRLQDLVSGGIDVEYYGTISIGTPPQDIVRRLASSKSHEVPSLKPEIFENQSVDFDTGSSDMLTKQNGLSTRAGFSTAFNGLRSSTYHNTLVPFTIRYGSGTLPAHHIHYQLSSSPNSVTPGSVWGTIAQDTVQVAGLTSSQQGFGDVNLCSSNFVGGEAEGMFGLAFSSISTAGQPSVNETPVGSPFQAAIDTGTSLIYLPTALATSIYAAIPDARLDTEDSTRTTTFWQYPCAASFNISFKFEEIGELSFSIDLRDFNIGLSVSNDSECVGGIVGQDFKDVEGRPLGILGVEMSAFIYN